MKDSMITRQRIWAAGSLLTLMISLAGCREIQTESILFDENLSDVTAARVALSDFFDALHAGEYAAAVDLYGGSYDIMIDYNPLIDPANHAALLQAACTINGAVCLVVASASRVEGDGMAGDGLTFLVEFQNNDGSIFVQDPCCGASPEEGEGLTAFTFRVRKVAGPFFLVMNPPVYQP